MLECACMHAHAHTLNAYQIAYLKVIYSIFLTLFLPYKPVYIYTIREGLGHENKLHILWAFKLPKNKIFSHNFGFDKYKINIIFTNLLIY